MQHSAKHLQQESGLAETHHATAQSYRCIPKHGYSAFHYRGLPRILTLSCYSTQLYERDPEDKAKDPGML